MLPKQHRLTESRDFTRIRRYGRSASTPLLALYVLPSSSPDVRVGFSVSKRVGKATVRNRVKRLMREAIRRQLADIRPEQDLVFIARPAAADVTYGEIFASTCQVLRKSRASQPDKVRNA